MYVAHSLVHFEKEERVYIYAVRIRNLKKISGEEKEQIFQSLDDQMSEEDVEALEFVNQKQWEILDWRNE